MADAAASVDRGDTLIAERIRRAQRAIRRTDIALTLVMWLACLMAVMLVWVLVDHWIIEIGPVLRVGAFLAVLAGSAWFLWRRLGVIVRGQLNPLYAAYLLERELPELDHGLASYVALREDRQNEGLRGVVIRSVGARAARRLAQRPEIDPTSGGRSSKLVATSVALFTLLVAYTVLSPKSTISSMRRLLLPLADVRAPTRVEIVSVLPGDVEIVQGEKLRIESKIRGLLASESPRVEYRGESGSATAPLQPGDQSQTYTGTIGGDDGVRDPLQYFVRAGDAEAGPFRVRVRSVPAVTITKVEYQPPAYTGLPTRSSPRGAIEGVEGTRVVITARVNRATEKSRIEFNPKPIRGEIRPTGGVLPLKISDSGRQVEGFWYLLTERGEVGVIPQTSYRIRVWDEHQTPNPDPVIYPIRVQPDLSPELEIVTPRNWPKEVQESAQQLVEIRAVDPDFGLTSLDVDVRQGNRMLKRLQLMRSDEGRRGQQVALYRFRPKELSLKHGDEVTLVARAADNHHRPGSDDMQPNITQTSPITLRVVADKHADPEQIAPDGDGAGPPDQSPATQDVTGGEREPQPADAASAAKDEQQEDGVDGQAQNGAGEAAPGDQPSPEGSQQQGPDAQQGADAQQDYDAQQDADAQQGGRGEATPGQEDGLQGAENQQPGDGEESPEPGAAGRQQADSQSEGGQGESGDAGAAQQTGSSGQLDRSGSTATEQNQDPQGQPQEGTGQSEGSPDGAAGAGTSPSDPQGEQGEGAQSGALQRDASAEPGGQSSGGDEGPLHDGEVFERALEYIRQQQQQQQQGADSGRQSNAGDNRDPQGDAQGAEPSPQPTPGEPPGQNQGGSDPSATPPQNGGQGQQGSDAASGDAESQAADAQQQEGGRGEQPGEDPQSGDAQGDGGERQSDPADGKQAGNEQTETGQSQEGQAPEKGAGEAEDGGDQSKPAGEGQPEGQSPGAQTPGSDGSPGQQPGGAGQQQPETKPQGAGSGSNASGAPGAQSPDGAGQQPSSPGGGSQQRQQPGSGSSGASPSQSGTPSQSNQQQPPQQGAAQDSASGDSGQAAGSDAKPAGGGEPADGASDAAGRPTGGTPTSQTAPGGDRPPAGQTPQGGQPPQGGQATPGGQAPAGSQPGGQGQGTPRGSGQPSDQPATAGGQGRPGAGGEVGEGIGSQPQSPNASPGAGSGQSSPQPGASQPVEGSPDGQGAVPDKATTKPGSRQGSGASGEASQQAGGNASGGSDPQRDAINMDYSEEATGMVLDYLKRQREKPDEELLDRLNFSADDLQDFVERWESARQLDETGQPEAYREQLRSLGLRPPGATSGGAPAVDDTQRGLRDAGNRNRVPERFQEAFDAFRRSLSRER